ncbi:MAG: TIGR02391 family protein [Turicibacter sp.]|nr:TIGR02391 family protein [Turicibacter sp.]
MKTKYENELRSLQSWINNVNNGLASGMRIVIDSASANNTYYQINAVANGIKEEYPVYANELKIISANLFKNPTYGTVCLNDVAFGELFIIIHHVVQEPVDMVIWREIHPRIAGICQGLFCDGYYDSAAEKAVKEVESRLRELFQTLKPGVTVPAKVGDIIGALLSENGAYHFVDLSTVSGKDYRRGMQSLFEGIFAAYRNPAAHKNLPCSKRESIEQIMLASQLMYVLDR